MALFSIFEVGGSALNAQNVRLNTIASNMANAGSVAGSAEQAYKSRQPVFASVYNQELFGNDAQLPVRVTGIVESQAENPKRYEPDNPMADEQGYVWQSNVNIIDEMTNMMVASRNYENSIEMLNTTKELLLSTLRLGE